MRKLVFFTSMCVLCGATMVVAPARADDIDLNTALQQTYIACAGIDEGLADMKKMAGINTVVTGVGTGLAVGAAVAGFAKAKTDAEIAEMEEKLRQMAEEQDIDGQYITPGTASTYYATHGEEVMSGSLASQSAIDEMTAKSKKLGNWRTGLMAGNTATSVAGAILAAKNRVSEDLQGQVDECIASVKLLQRAIAEARMRGDDVTEAQTIYSACREYEYVDLTPINKRAKGAMISSAVSAVTGGIGTVTSAMANSDSTRNGDEQKEKNLNSASNALAVGSGVASAAATVFNATQIAAIKKVASVSEKCTEVLQ